MINNSTLNGPSKPPASGGPAKQAIVFLHGYASDGNDLISLSQFFASALPDAAFFSPHAPEPGEMGMGRQWFTLQGYDPDLLRRDPDRMSDAFTAMYEGAQISAKPLNQYLDQIQADTNLEAKDIALIGFSQGTMMALHTGLRRSPALGAILGYSGALVGSERLADDMAAKPPMLLIHGSADDVVPVMALTHIQKTFDRLSVPYSAHIVPNHGHGIEQMGATLGRDFLAKTLLTN